MPVDQAAGLRRRSAWQPLRCIHCFFDTADASSRLARALRQHGWTVLLIDSSGRLFPGAATRSLFDWRRQLASGSLSLLPQGYGDDWHAPGVPADAAGLPAVAQRYDCVLFDAVANAQELTLMPDAANSLAIEVDATHAVLQHRYALLKTLARTGDRPSAGLLGDPAACAQLEAACGHFLGEAAMKIYSVAGEDDAFLALAARMAGGAARQPAVCEPGNPRNMTLEHGC